MKTEDGGEGAEQATGLEPPFPYVMTRFDAGFFEL